MAASTNLLEDVENSFKACLALLTSPENFNIDIESEEIKSSTEQVVPKFLDSVKQLDVFFTQKRLLLTTNKPELCVNTDLAELQAELQRKDAVLQKHYTVVKNLVAKYQTSSPTSSNQPPQASQSTNQNLGSGQQQSTGTNQNPQQQPAAAGGMMVNTAALHSAAAYQNIQGNAYNQGPLAYLEQTTSSIGHTRMS